MNDSTAEEGRQPAGGAVAEDYDDDALAEMAEGFAAEADRLFRLARGARAELLKRLVDRDAKLLDTLHWRGKVKPGPIHHAVDDPERFRQRLLPLVGADDLAKAFVQPPTPALRVDHRGVNDLAKLGGEVKAIIEQERTDQWGAPSLELERKEQPVVDPD